MTRKLHNPIYYGKDLAFVHDLGYGELARHAAQTVWQLIKDKSGETLIIDLGCGSGILEKELTKRKLDIIGLDISPAMIEIARKNAPEATFINTSIYDFDIPDCDLVCAIGECFNYLFDDKSTLNQLKDLFSRIHGALRSEGYFMFDILTPELFETNYISSRKTSQDNWTLYTDIEVDKAENLLTRKINLFLKKDGGFVKSKETHRQRLYHQKEIATILKGLGFGITQIHDYNGMMFRPGHTGFIGKKL